MRIDFDSNLRQFERGWLINAIIVDHHVAMWRVWTWSDHIREKYIGTTLILDDAWLNVIPRHFTMISGFAIIIQ